MIKIKRRRAEQITVETTRVKKSKIAAAGGGEESQSSVEGNLKMVAGGFYLPKYKPKKPQGEDAHFICVEEQTIGVADGVGGWAKMGIDAGEYARELMTKATVCVHDEPKGCVDPRRVLNEAFLNTKAKGSSTACIVTLKKNVLHAVNVGDSGFMVFRNNKLMYRSPIQQHRFNFPYQLGNDKNSDHPDSAIEFQIRVEQGDIVVVGTDGLLDNMYPFEIGQVLEKKSAEGRLDTQECACYIAELALYHSFDKYSPSPFAVASQMEGHNHKGGKIDDITVLVAHIL